MPTENKQADPFGPHGRTFHVHLSVRAALRDFSKRQLKGMFRLDGGRACTAEEAKDHLLEALAQGKEVLPFGPPCAGFDFSGGGCPGHELASMEIPGRSALLLKPVIHSSFRISDCFLTAV